jgi:hypothetical protein
MRMKINELLLFVILASLTTPFALAKSKGEIRDITGCLSKGDSAHEFLLTGNDGSTWEVRSSRVALAKHVGLKKSDTEHGHMKITAVKMVSDSCQK